MHKINNMTKPTPVRTAHNQYCGYSSSTYNILGSGDGQKLRLNPRSTPINTGKVLIGSAYQPTPCQIAEDQMWLQNALLNDRLQSVKPLPMTLADKVIFALMVAAVALVWLTR